MDKISLINQKVTIMNISINNHSYEVKKGERLLDIADERVGGDEYLASIARVGKGFLVAGHVGGEDDFAHPPSGGAETPAEENGAVREN